MIITPEFVIIRNVWSAPGSGRTVHTTATKSKWEGAFRFVRSFVGNGWMDGWLRSQLAVVVVL